MGNTDKIVYPENLFDEKRSGKGYFFRVCTYNESIDGFLLKCCTAAKKHGRIIETKLANPSTGEAERVKLPNDFALDKVRIKQCVKINFPFSEPICSAMTEGILSVAAELTSSGKNKNIIKNLIVKYFCWINKYFHGILSECEKGFTPKIVYAGEPAVTELHFFYILSECGADIITLETSDSANSADAEEKFSQKLITKSAAPFPEGYSLAGFKEKAQISAGLASLASQPASAVITNAWISGDILEDITKPPAERDGGKLCNCYARINGAEDITKYLNSLYKAYQNIRGTRKVLVIEKSIPIPTPDEIASVKRGNYSDAFSMVKDLSKNIVHPSAELQGIMVKAFSEVVTEYYSAAPEMRKALTKAVYLLCWLRRYQKDLFAGWKAPDICCLFYMGGCRDDNEAMFIKMMARLPADVIILAPDLSKKCCLTDEWLYERNYVNSFPVENFPQDNKDLQVGTVAYYAEQEISSQIYGSGLYRNYQYASANAIRLRTMYEELFILWKEELKFRPNFSTEGNVVSMPVIMAKVSGVKDGDVQGYWDSIYGLITDDTIVLKNTSLVKERTPCEFAVPLLKNGKLQKKLIKENPQYKYGFLSEERQNYLLDKIQLLLDKKMIVSDDGGIDYILLAITLGIDNSVLRLIQKFDFTASNPKIVYINTTESVISFEDSVMCAFLNLVGFDVVFFLPTGYQCAEKYYSGNIAEHHQIGTYMFDLQIPNFKHYRVKKESVFKKLFSKR